jgi:hypothetical protein
MHGTVLPSDRLLAYFRVEHKANFSNWSFGVMEYWSIGVLKNKKCRGFLPLPLHFV